MLLSFGNRPRKERQSFSCRAKIQHQRAEEDRLGKKLPMWLDEGEEEVRVYPDINAADEEGSSPIMLAAAAGWDKTVELLLSLGASTTRKNIDGYDAFLLAKKESQEASLAVYQRVTGAPERKRRAARCVLLLDSRSLLRVVQQGDFRRTKYLLEQVRAARSLAFRFR